MITTRGPQGLRKHAGWVFGFLLTGLLLGFGQWRSGAAFFAVTVDFRQAANNETSGPVTGLGNVHWINSILQQNNARYFENMSVPQRTLLTGLAGRNHSLVFSHLATKGGHHGYDFLTSYEQAVATAGEQGITLNLNPCGPELGPPSSLAATCNTLRTLSYVYTVGIPDDPFVSVDGPTQARLDAYEARYGNRRLKLYTNQPVTTATLTLSHDVPNGGDAGDSEIFYTLSWTTSIFSPASTQALIEYAGHLAVCDELPGIGWGAGKGASQIGGASYHFRLHTADGAQLGSSDHQIKAADILPFPPACAINGPAQACPRANGLTYSTDLLTGVTYQWTITAGDATFCGGNTGPAVCVNTGILGFTLQLTTTGAGGSATCSKTVEVIPAPQITATVPPVICGVSVIQLAATSSQPGTTFSWTGPGIVSGGNTATPTVNAPGVYTVVGTGPNGCTGSAFVTVFASMPFSLTASAGAPLTCTNTQTTVTASASAPGLNYSWSGPGIVGANTGVTIQVNQPGVYTVTATDPTSGCANTAQATVTQSGVLPDVTATAGPPLTCTTTQTTVSASSATMGVTFSWAGPGIVGPNTGATIQVNQAGTYTVTATNPANGCTKTAQAVVTQSGALPNVSATAGAPLTCTTLQTTVSASSSTPGVSFSWSGPGIMGSVPGATISVNQPGTYTVTVTNPANGCTNTATATVTQNNTPPNVSATAGAPLGCATTQTTVTANSTTPGVSFSWSGPGIVGANTGATIQVNQPGAYIVTATNPANGCTNTATATVTQSGTLPNVTATAGPPLSCSVSLTSVTAASTTLGVTFSWTGPGIVGANTGAAIQVNRPGVYTVTATDPANGCTRSAAASVTQDLTPPSVNAGPDQALCAPGPTTTFTLNGSVNRGTALWSVVSGPVVIANPNALMTTALFTGTGTATLKLQATDGQCMAEDTVVLAAGSLLVSLTTRDSCEVPTTLTANAAGGAEPYSYTWTGPGGFTANTPTITATVPGPYTVTVTDARGCTGTQTAAACDAIVSDQKAGSLLFFNLYTSNASAPDLEDTRLNLTNTHPTAAVALHLFFVDGSTCSVANRFICLTPNQTVSLLASAFDPGVSGYLLAVAVDRQTGCPINFNYLIGDAHLKLAGGHKANLAAEALRARYGATGARLPGCDAASTSATLRLDGVSYDPVARTLAWNNIPSVIAANGMTVNRPLLVLNRVGGDLHSGGAVFDSLFGLLFDDAEHGYSFSIGGGCQIRQVLTDFFPRTAPRLSTVIPAGRTGWLKLSTNADYGMLGAGINFSSVTRLTAGVANQGHNLHKLTLSTQSVYVMPIQPPGC